MRTMLAASLLLVACICISIAHGQTVPTDAPAAIVIEVDAMGGCRVGDRDVDREAISKLVADAAKADANQTLTIRADRACRTGEVQEIIRLCQQAGVDNFRLAVLGEEPATGPNVLLILVDDK